MHWKRLLSKITNTNRRFAIVNTRSGEILGCNTFNKQDNVMKIFNVCVSKVLHLIDQRRDSVSIFKSALLVLFILIQQTVMRNSVIVYNKRAFSFKVVYFGSNYFTFVRIQTEILAVKFSVGKIFILPPSHQLIQWWYEWKQGRKAL